MKKVVILLLSGLACISSLTGCSEPVDPAELTEKYGPEPISANMLAQDIYDTLQYEWDLFDSLSAEQKMISSHIPGICYKDFADWVTCEVCPFQIRWRKPHGWTMERMWGCRRVFGILPMCRPAGMALKRDMWNGSAFRAVIGTATSGSPLML